MPLSLTQPPIDVLPSRVILFWGLAFNPVLYPQLNGWVLCDGANGTHDMRDRVARGTPALGVVGTAGGTEDHCHTFADAATSSVDHCHPGSVTDTTAAHDHPGSTTSQYTHAHAGSTLADCAWDHTHCWTVGICPFPGGGPCRVEWPFNTTIEYLDEGHSHWIGHSGPGGIHGHSLTIAADVNHQHTPAITGDSHNHATTMSDDAHQHAVALGNVNTRTGLVPPYRDLHLIMKL